jgi:hypothetical protein
MTLYETIITDQGVCGQWLWRVVRIETVSGTETILAEGVEPNALRALDRAATIQSKPEGIISDQTFTCHRCQRTE